MVRRAPASLLLVLVSAAGAAACGVRAGERGRQLYALHGCAACHGVDGRGGGPSAKRLDVPPSNLTDARTYKQGSDAADVAVSIRKGVGAMPAFRDITDDEAGDISAWIVSLQRQPVSAGGQP
jgi:mono/diheme cytochrome c family protein